MMSQAVCLVVGPLEQRARGERDKIAVLDEREGKSQDFTNQRSRSGMGDLRKDGRL